MPSDRPNQTGQFSGSRSGLQELVSRAKAGSHSALGRALSLCRPRLLRDARRGVGNRLRLEADASDVVQDTFFNATKGFGGFRGQHAGEFVSWLCRILANRLAQIARSAGRARGAATAEELAVGAESMLHSQSDGEPSPSNIVANQETAELIKAGLARLSPRDQQVLGLRFEEQLTFVQIGERIGLREDAARMVFKRAVKRLQRELPRYIEA